MIPIAQKQRVNWAKIKAEYIGGGTSYRKLSEKHHVALTGLKRQAKIEGWTRLRAEAESKAEEMATQKTIDAAVDNALIAAEIKRNLLLRLKRIEEKYPMDATEVKAKVGNSWATYRLRDLTAAYRDLTEDIQTSSNATNDLLQSLIDLERRAGL